MIKGEADFTSELEKLVELGFQGAYSSLDNQYYHYFINYLPLESIQVIYNGQWGYKVHTGLSYTYFSSFEDVVKRIKRFLKPKKTKVVTLEDMKIMLEESPFPDLSVKLFLELLENKCKILEIEL